MRVAVVGGAGMIGGPLVAELLDRGHDVRVISRGSSDRPPPPGAAHFVADVATGENLEEALAGVEAVVDATSSRRRPREVMVEGTRRLVEVGSRAGVRHHLLISIVGCDRVSTTYYRCKAIQEEVLGAGRVPWSVLRSTQVHPFVAEWLEGAARFGLRPTGAMRLQPIDVDVVGRRIADALEADPAGRLPDVGGPEVQTLGELRGAWQRASDRRLLPLRLPSIGRLGRSLRDGGLCNEAAAAPGPTFEEWL